MPRDSGAENNPVLNLIRNSTARGDFQILSDRGAQPAVLLALFTNLYHYSRDWDCFELLTTSRLNRKKVKDTLKKIRHAADSIESLRELIYSPRLSLEVEEDLLSLRGKVIFFCDHIQTLLRERDYRQPPTWTHMLAMLIHYIKHTTGAFHDEEVSALISAVTSQTYDATALKAWRTRNKALLLGIQLEPKPRRRKT